MVACGATAGLALSRPEPDQSCDGTPDQPCHAGRGEGGRNLPARVAAHLAALLGLDPGIATHLLEQNVDIRVIPVLLGHAKLEATALYARVAVGTIRDVESPLERLGLNLAGRSRPA